MWFSYGCSVMVNDVCVFPQCSNFQARLAKIKAAATDIDPKAVQQTEKRHSVAVKEWRKRKRMVSAFLIAFTPQDQLHPATS